MWKVFELLPADQLAALKKLRTRLANAEVRAKLDQAKRDRDARTVAA